MSDTHCTIHQCPTCLDVARGTVPAAVEPRAALVVEVLESRSFQAERLNEIVAVLRVERGPLLDVDLKQLWWIAILTPRAMAMSTYH